MLGISGSVFCDEPSTQAVGRVEVSFHVLAAPGGIAELTFNWRVSDSLSLRVRPLMASMSSGGSGTDFITQNRDELNVGLEWAVFRRDWKGLYVIGEAGVFKGNVNVPGAEDYDFTGWDIRGGLGYRWRFKQSPTVVLELGAGIGTQDTYRSPAGTETNTGTWRFGGVKLGVEI